MGSGGGGWKAIHGPGRANNVFHTGWVEHGRAFSFYTELGILARADSRKNKVLVRLDPKKNSGRVCRKKGKARLCRRESRPGPARHS